MRTIIAGNNKLASDILEWLVQNHKKDIVGIIAEGRDMVENDLGWEKPFRNNAEKVASQLNVPFFVGNISNFSQEVRELSPDIISPFRHKALVKCSILELPNLIDPATGSRLCTNIHYGALPKYGGMSPGFWAIQNGETFAGVTLQYMGKEFDTGPIFSQRGIDLREGKSTLMLPDKTVTVSGLTDFEVYQKSNELAVKMYKEFYKSAINGNIGAKSQNLSSQLYYTQKQTQEAKERIGDITQMTDEEIGRYARARYFPLFGYPKAVYHGKEIELRLENDS